MSSLIKISIITSTYNAESCLENLIKSIFPQKTKDIEYIIIDGGSKDKTLPIIEKYKQYIDFFISEPDKGIYDAWNKGIKVSTGDWIMFVGADDLLLPDALNRYIDALTSDNINDNDYICAYNEYVDTKGALIKVFGENASFAEMKRKMTAAHVASLHNRRLFDEIGYYNIQYKICADYELLLRKGSALKSFFIPYKIARMQVGGTSFSFKAIIEIYKIRKEHKSVPLVLNWLLFFRNCGEYYFFIFRKSLLGFNL